ncbi:MAG: hypothetical protein CSA97_04700 [Bacteroidetes bacterium]|nr:MAG: hypothetical protein CSA97_04700 [Bacteroidota bacterium]
MDNENSNRFLTAFNDIEAELTDRMGHHKAGGFAQILNMLKRNDAQVRLHYHTLRQFAKLRNAIVHNMREDFVIAEPHMEVVEEIERIRDYLAKPPIIADYMTTHPFHVPKDTPLAEVITTFKKRNFQRCPIIDRSGVCGLITAKSITKWIASILAHPEKKANDLPLERLMDRTVEDVLPFCSQNEYAIVPRNASLADAVYLFRSSIEKGKYLQSLLVTAEGTPQSALVGIIAPSDLPRLFTDDIDLED